MKVQCCVYVFTSWCVHVCVCSASVMYTDEVCETILTVADVSKPAWLGGHHVCACVVY